MKRKLSFLMAVIMICVCCHIGVYSAEEAQPDVSVQSGLLHSMGIIDSEFAGQTELTRGEFALWLSRLIGLDENSYTTAEYFSDVPSSNKYAGAVGAVSQLSIMNGISKTEFGVKQNISYTDAMVALIRVLGYEVAAKSDGGYPAGYVKRAAWLGLDKNISDATGNTYAQILIMCFNALDIPYLDVYGKISNATLMQDIHGIYESEGIVTANMYTSISAPEDSVRSDEIAIDKEVYVTDDADMAKLIGMHVNYWFEHTDVVGVKNLVYAYADKNDTLTIQAEDIVKAENNMVDYEDERERIDTAKLQPGFSYILNNRTVTDRKTKDVKISDGEIKLIDNNDDGYYDIVMASRRETMVFQGVDETEDIIYCREGNIITEPFDKESFAKYYLKDDTDGSLDEISIDEIPADSVLTVYRSADNKYLEVYACTEVVFGVIQQLGDEIIVVDGVEYEYPLKTPVQDLHVGAEANFSIDIYGRLVYLEDEEYYKEPIYGYLFDYARAYDLVNKSRLRIIDGDKVQILTLADTVRVDDSSTYAHNALDGNGTLFENGDAKRQLIRYRLNKDKEITDIYTMDGYSTESITRAPDINKNTETAYYQWHRIYAGKYILPENNYFLVVPTDEDELDDIELYGTSYYFGDDISSCYCEIFDVNDDMEAGAVIIYAQDKLKGKVTTTANTAVGIVQKLYMGDDYNYIYLWNGSETLLYELDKENNPDLYAFGDVVRYVLGKDNVITTLDMVLDVGTTPENTPMPVYYQDGGYDYHHFSRVYKKLDTHYILIPNYNNPTFDDSVANRIVAPASFSRCAVIDMRQKKIINGSYSSMARYFEEEGYGACYAYTRLYKWNTAKELFIYKF